MFIFGHLGIGSKIVSPFTRGLPLRYVLLGTLLPDLIDKPLYYGLSLITGRSGAELGLISGTRTVGHTGIFLILLTCATIYRKSRVLAAIVLGVASHLILDAIGDHFLVKDTLPTLEGVIRQDPSSAMMALIFPMAGIRFAVIPFERMGEHLSSFKNPYFYVTEIFGALILFWDYWKSSHKKEIVARFQDKRIENRRLKRERRESQQKRD